MTKQKNTLTNLFAACWKDEALKGRFLSDPKTVLGECGLPVQPGLNVKMVENADDCALKTPRHIFVTGVSFKADEAIRTLGNRHVSGATARSSWTHRTISNKIPIF